MLEAAQSTASIWLAVHATVLVCGGMAGMIYLGARISNHSHNTTAESGVSQALADQIREVAVANRRIGFIEAKMGDLEAAYKQLAAERKQIEDWLAGPTAPARAAEGQKQD